MATVQSIHEFHAATRTWFAQSFAGPTPVQQRGWPLIAAGDHTLLIAPTGSGKTLAAFLGCIDGLLGLPADAPEGVRVVYVSPLKALVYDIDRNLQQPLAGITRAANQLGTDLRIPAVDVRTGDTPQSQRRRQAAHPAPILVTTPESLYLILGSAARTALRTVQTVIVDEIHTMVSTKRGAHLGISLERLAQLAAKEPQRIGLSATARPPELVARYLGGDRPVSTIDVTGPPKVDLEIVVPTPDMRRPTTAETAQPSAKPAAKPGMWPLIFPQLYTLVRQHRSTIIFVNSRALCERICQHLNDLSEDGGGPPIAQTHHGSLSHERRGQTEQLLKDGKLPAIVATSSLELGIDMGAVDLVVLVESPGSVARGLQRIGRSGHRIDETSKGRVFPKHPGDLLEATVLARGILAGDIESVDLPRNPLDVLAQQIVAMCAVRPWPVGELHRLVRRCASFESLDPAALHSVLDMLDGRYPATELADLRPRITWDRQTNQVRGRRGSASLAAISGGTIPDRGLFSVNLSTNGTRIGELDEEMVYESRVGDVVTLGASSWRVNEITRDRVLVSPAPGEPGREPFWHGDRQGRSLELGRAIGAFVRQLSALTPTAARQRLKEEYHLDRWAAANLLAYLADQHEATGTLPTDRAITVEHFIDEVGDGRICILSPFGARIHIPWALALQAMLSARVGFKVQIMFGDDGIALRFADVDQLPSLDELIPASEQVEQLVVEQLGESPIFSSHFRQNAARALLLPRYRPGRRMPLWAQRLKAQNLLGVVRQYPSFPMILETYRSCLQESVDVPALVGILKAIEGGQIQVDQVQTSRPSPFAQSLVFAEIAVYMYEYDNPVAERRSQALSLDQDLLRGLLGVDQLRSLLDAEVITQTESTLQRLTSPFVATCADELHDTLRILGDLSREQLADRASEDPTPWLEQLRAEARAIAVDLVDETRWIATQDAALYRDALGVRLPPELSATTLPPAPRPLATLLRRWLQTHGPFTVAEFAIHYGLPQAEVAALLEQLRTDNLAARGEFRPDGTETEWCDPDVLRRLRRNTLEQLRQQIQPVGARALARFMAAWHRIDSPWRGRVGLSRALDQLEGLALSFAELERTVLPSRVTDYHPRMLDELGTTGQLVWVGCGALAGRDGRVALYRRNRAAALLEPPMALKGMSKLQQELVDHLTTHGASFFAELLASCAAQSPADVLAELWDLAWGGWVTNDAFQPLRAWRAYRKGRASRANTTSAASAGRWSLVSSLIETDNTTEEQLAKKLPARTEMLLARYGIVSRSMVATESLPDGFAPIYRRLRTMEFSGKVRRGMFVQDMGGAQFASAATVDQLRTHGHAKTPAPVTVLAACDPANPYGAVVPWPTLRNTDQAGNSPRGAPQRRVGVVLVLVDGHPVLYVEPTGRKLRTFKGADDDTIKLAAAELRKVAARRRGKYLRVERIDGEPARQATLRSVLGKAGFTADHKGLVLEAGTWEQK